MKFQGEHLLECLKRPFRAASTVTHAASDDARRAIMLIKAHLVLDGYAPFQLYAHGCFVDIVIFYGGFDCSSSR